MGIDPPPYFALPVGGEQAMMIGWAYLMAAIITVDAYCWDCCC